MIEICWNPPATVRDGFAKAISKPKEERMPRVRGGSVLRTDTGAFWYCDGDWRLKGFENAYPAVLAYVPCEDVAVDSEKFKTLLIDGRTYIKVYGQPLPVYREILRSSQPAAFYSTALGKGVYVKQSRITEARDPLAFAEQFLPAMERERATFQSLADVLHVPLKSIGISGSTLVLGRPERRHEIDVVFYGRSACRRIARLIERNRDDVVFSRVSLPPFHLPFQHHGIWFDPQFSEGDRERHPLDGASIRIVRRFGETTVRIKDDRDGVFFPALYGTTNRRRLISFRLGHRGFFRRGDTVVFPSLSLIRMTYANGQLETAYGILNDEWGEKR